MNTLPPGPYRHYKGGWYCVDGVATHSETQEPMVVYRAMSGDKRLWVRPLVMFTEMVEHEGRLMPRFQVALPQPVTETFV